MVNIHFTKSFKKEFKKLSYDYKQKVEKQLKKIHNNPLIGKPLRYSLKGEMSVYIKPYRLIYEILPDKDIFLLRISHRKKVYRPKD